MFFRRIYFCIIFFLFFSVMDKIVKLGLLKVAQNDKKKPQNLSVAQTSLLSWNGGPSYCCY